jgi:hypothetical protein
MFPAAIERGVCLFDDVLMPLSKYFSYIVAVSLIGGGNRRTRLVGNCL